MDSRWPIVDSGQRRDPEVGNRDLALAHIDILGEVDLWVVSVHLLTRSQGARDAEVPSLVEAIRDQPAPEEDLLVVGGGLNSRRRNERAQKTLSEVVGTLAPFPGDGANPPDGNTNRNRSKPYDWVLTDAPLGVLEVALQIDDLSFPDGLVSDSRIFSRKVLDRIFPPARRAEAVSRRTWRPGRRGSRWRGSL